jgi:hypothetical protein
MEVKSGVITKTGLRWIAAVNCSNLTCVNKGKGTVRPRTGHEGPEGRVEI